MCVEALLQVFYVMENSVLRHHDHVLWNMHRCGMGVSVFLHRFLAHLVYNTDFQDARIKLRLSPEDVRSLHPLLPRSHV